LPALRHQCDCPGYRFAHPGYGLHAAGLHEQDVHLDTEHLRDAPQAFHGRVRFATLDRADLTLCEAGFIRESVLRQAARYAAQAHIARKRLAAALNVPVTVFYAGGGAKRSSIDERGFAYLRTRGALRLVRAYAGIRKRAPRIALLALAEALTQPGD